MNQRNEENRNMKVGDMKDERMVLLNNESRDHKQPERKIPDKVVLRFPSII